MAKKSHGKIGKILSFWRYFLSTKLDFPFYITVVPILTTSACHSIRQLAETMPTCEGRIKKSLDFLFTVMSILTTARKKVTLKASLAIWSWCRNFIPDGLWDFITTSIRLIQFCKIFANSLALIVILIFAMPSTCLEIHLLMPVGFSPWIGGSFPHWILR